jgi:hypothetical protein
MERLIQALDELDDLVSMIKQRWLRRPAPLRAEEPPPDGAI